MIIKSLKHGETKEARERMTLDWFSKLLKANNAISITDDLIIFNDYELYSFSTREGKQYSSLEALCVANPEVKKIIEETDEFFYKLEGGRGSSSGNGEMGGGFNHAGGGDGQDEGYGKRLLPAELNVQTNGKHSLDSAIDRFQKKYGDANREYGVEVDDNGYVTQHIQGGKTSVSISGGKGKTIIHNHPSGGNFSDSDLISTASSQAKGIVAVSSNTDKKSVYKFKKNENFKPKEFIKAVKKAKWPKNMSYDKGADWWLKKNQKKYGYKYESKGVPKD